MKLHNTLKSTSTSVTKMFIESDDERKKIQFVSKWPKHLIFLHQLNEYGAPFLPILQMAMEGHDF